MKTVPVKGKTTKSGFPFKKPRVSNMPRAPSRVTEYMATNSLVRHTSLDLNPKNKTQPTADEDRLWPEEIQAVEDIREGRKKTVDVTAEEFIQEIKSVINEQSSTA